MQHVRHVLHIRSLCREFVFFLFQVHPADVADSNNRTDDTDNTERISAGVSQCDGITRVVQLIQCFLCGTQTRSIGDCTVKDTYYHGEVDSSVDEVNAQSYCNIQYNYTYCKHIQCHASFLKGREERRSYLQTDTEYEQN